MIQTYQDFVEAPDKASFCYNAINKHKSSTEYLTAIDADNYDKQRNTTIMEYTKMLWTLTGSQVVDFTASNNKIASNFFHKLNVQRNSYLLGNGVTFEEDNIKAALGENFDSQLKKLGYKALIHGVAFGFWNVDRLHVFPITHFVPFWDEETGALRAGVRFWRISEAKPLFFTLYEEDGYTRYKVTNRATNTSGVVVNDNASIVMVEDKRAYKLKVEATKAQGEEVVGEENYSSLPIIPLYGSELKQSTLVGMKRAIDSYDLIRSGFANDLTDCAQIYWIIKNAGGMSNADLNLFRDKLKLMHIADVNAEDGESVEPVTQEIPFNARIAYLTSIREGIYEDFSALDVKSISAAAKTATEITASYQPLDEVVDDFEYQVIDFMMQLLSIMGTEGTPSFKRNRIANQEAETQMVLSAAEYLDQETVLEKLPFLTVDDVAKILDRIAAENMSNFGTNGASLEDE